MKIYNTISRKKEEFNTIHKGIVNMYVCGPTTYNFIHIGNARPMVVFDTFRNYLASIGYQVNYIQNYTDVDDKIINKSKEEGIGPLELAAKYIEEYRKDANSLRVKEATFHPKVSENIEEIIEFIDTLIKKGFAYEVEGDVYFDVRNYKPYGKLSGKNIDDLKSGARVEIGDKKRSPLDFALWKTAKEGEINWVSPWGNGRPGWHIECSTMSMKYTKSPTLDIHGGGQDLIFPHHENEVAQSEGYTGKPFVNYWMHNGFITVNKEKMSKSLGNFFLVREILEKFSGEVIRYFILSSHYRNPIDFNDGALVESEKSLTKLMTAYNNLEKLINDNRDNQNDILENEFTKIEEKIEKALQDDFNTALAFSFFFDGSKIVTKAIKENLYNQKGLEKAFSIFKKYLVDILAVLPFEKVEEEVLEGDDNGTFNKVMEILLDVRNMARKDKNFAYGDLIRNELTKLDIEIIDTKEGSTWKKK
ncbi:MAG: cysteinyl-tRNA synthetase [Fusobacteria bacterium]|nr:MAG: cysteinyl-tRNA synthetase [Fusobacteriota bacterium]KAF0227925.1 MAG: cysteinyl-tRNA [Fusobacteriota bacterium]